MNLHKKCKKKLLLLVVQIGKTEINILQKEWEKKLFYLIRIKRKTIFESHYPNGALTPLIKTHPQLSRVMANCGVLFHSSSSRVTENFQVTNNEE